MPIQKIYQVDAFADTLYSGNPAAVCILDSWITDKKMQLIARENNLSETAFVVPDNNLFHIRWFTPNTEVDLCGHATLAAAYVIFHFTNCTKDNLTFSSKSGLLHVYKADDMLAMDFPALSYRKVNAAQALIQALGITPVEVYQSEFDLLCIYNNYTDVMMLKPDFIQLAKFEHRGIITSTIGQDSDVYSRCFYPSCDVLEDPVTGSAHCVIAPYWSHRLNKPKIHARQGGSRQGELWCELKNDRVILSGHCRLYLTGEIYP